MSLKKLRPEIMVSFNQKAEEPHRDYEDKYSEEMPDIEAIKEKYGTVVWCDFKDCLYNKSVEEEGLQRTTGTILRNRTYNPISEQEHIWPRLCVRGEIAIKFTKVVSNKTSTAQNVPSCFTTAARKSGHIDFMNSLQSDLSPTGGSMDSQAPNLDGYGHLDSNSIYSQ